MDRTKADIHSLLALARSCCLRSSSSRLRAPPAAAAAGCRARAAPATIMSLPPVRTGTVNVRVRMRDADAYLQRRQGVDRYQHCTAIHRKVSHAHSAAALASALQPHVADATRSTPLPVVHNSSYQAGTHGVARAALPAVSSPSGSLASPLSGASSPLSYRMSPLSHKKYASPDGGVFLRTASVHASPSQPHRRVSPHISPPSIRAVHAPSSHASPSLTRSRSQPLAALSPKSPKSPLSPLSPPAPRPPPPTLNDADADDADDDMVLIEDCLHQRAEHAWDGGLAALLSVVQYTPALRAEETKPTLRLLHHAAQTHAIFTVDLFVMARELFGARVVFCSRRLGIDSALCVERAATTALGNRLTLSSQQRLCTPHPPLRSPVAGAHMLGRNRVLPAAAAAVVAAETSRVISRMSADDLLLDALVREARRAHRLFDFLLGVGSMDADAAEQQWRHTLLPRRERCVQHHVHSAAAALVRSTKLSSFLSSPSSSSSAAASAPDASMATADPTLGGALFGRRLLDGAGARRCSAMLLRRVSMSELCAAIETQHSVILLVDPAFLRCSLCDTSHMRAHDDANTLHFIVLVGVDKSRQHVYYLDPHSASTMCCAAVASIEAARTAPGTDEDTLFFHTSACACVDGVDTPVACFLSPHGGPPMVPPAAASNFQFAFSEPDSVAHAAEQERAAKAATVATTRRRGGMKTAAATAESASHPSMPLLPSSLPPPSRAGVAFSFADPASSRSGSGLSSGSGSAAALNAGLLVSRKATPFMHSPQMSPIPVAGE